MNFVASEQNYIGQIHQINQIKQSISCKKQCCVVTSASLETSHCDLMKSITSTKWKNKRKTRIQLYFVFTRCQYGNIILFVKFELNLHILIKHIHKKKCLSTR